jgi:hypothetical protein
MPGKGHLPDLQERILKSLKANTNRTAGGLGSNASPGMTRDRIAATMRGSGQLATSARSSQIDAFEIVDDTDAAFTLTYTPIFDSWNVSLGWPLENVTDYAITGRTLTIGDPVDIFRGTADNGPRILQVQYDYLSGVPTVPGDTYDAPEVVGVPWVVYPYVDTFRQIYFRLEGYSGDGSNIGMAFDNAGATAPPYTVNPAHPSGYGSTIWLAVLQRPWFLSTPPGGIEISVAGTLLYADTDPITTDSSSPPTSYSG